jgi:glycerol-3-phosphate dehydrogenase
LSEAEVRWLMEHEWARTVDDVLWRRTKAGLRFSADEAAAFDEWMRQATGGAGSPQGGTR